MKQKTKNYTYHFLRSIRIAMGLVFLFVNPSWGQQHQLEQASGHQVNQIRKIELLQVLTSLQEQSGFTFIFDKEILEDKVISFDKISRQQLNRLLLEEISRQTNLQFTPISKNTFLIKRKKREKVWLIGLVKDKANQPMVGANIAIIGQQKGVISDDQGSFKLEIGEGEHTLSVSYVGFESITKKIIIDGYEDFKINFVFKKLLDLDEVLVVGNRFSPKTLLETAVPVDVVNSERINQSNQGQLTQLLQYETPSFHSSIQTISDGTDHIDPISLKGLGPDQVLVLVNGKRRHFSSLVNVNGTIGRGSVGTDLNAIPLAAIEKVEILKDGAIALYGSDAIGGVINFQLKESIDKGHVQINTSITDVGDGEHFSLNTHYGLKTFGKGYTNLTFYFQNRSALNRSGEYQGIIFGDERDEDPTFVQAFYDQTGFKGRQVISAGNSAMTNTGLFLNTGIPIGEHFKFYNISSLNYRNGRASGFYRFPYEKAKQSGLYPLGFLPKIHTDIFDFSSVFGIKGKIKDWLVDFSNNLGQNSFTFNIHNSNNASLGLQSPTSAEAGGFSYLQNLVNVDVTRKGIWQLPINLAFGSEFRLEKYTQKEGEEVSWQDYGELTIDNSPKQQGFQLFNGFSPENATKKFRYNVGFYGEIEGEITDKWLLALAGRFENYSDFGSNISWKMSSRYRLTNTLTIRSTFNTGFRAPSLQQNYFSSRSLQFLPDGEEIVSNRVAHDNHDSPIVRRLEIPNLKPELSKNFSIGMAAHLMKNFTFTLDAYHIMIKDRVVLSGQISPKGDDQLSEILSSSAVDRIQFFTNAIDTKTTGIDARLNYDQHIFKGHLKLFLGIHVNKTKVSEHISTTPILENYRTDIFSREEIARLERGQPSSKFIFSGNYKIKKWQFLFRSTRFGSVQYIHPADEDNSKWIRNQYNGQKESRDQLFRSKWISDIDVTMNIIKGFHLTLGINNIFNVYPDKHTHFANTNNGILQYSRRVQQFGVKGRWWTLKALYEI